MDWLENAVHGYRNSFEGKKRSTCRPYVAILMAYKKFCDKKLQGNVPSGVRAKIDGILTRVAEGAKIDGVDADSRLATIVEKLGVDGDALDRIGDRLATLIYGTPDALLGSYEGSKDSFTKGRDKKTNYTSSDIAASAMSLTPAEFKKRWFLDASPVNLSAIKSAIEKSKPLVKNVPGFSEFCDYVHKNLSENTTHTLADKALTCYLKPYADSYIDTDGKKQRRFVISSGPATGLGDHKWTGANKKEQRFHKEGSSVIVEFGQRAELFKLLFHKVENPQAASEEVVAASLFAGMVELSKEKEE
jgi:hypothetical protein